MRPLLTQAVWKRLPFYPREASVGLDDPPRLVLRIFRFLPLVRACGRDIATLCGGLAG